MALPRAIVPKMYLQGSRWLPRYGSFKPQTRSLEASQTNYRHGEQVVHWKEGDRPAEARCDCSGFLDALLTRSSGYGEDDFKKWFGVKRPLAAHYHDVIAMENCFTRIKEVKSIQPGDILAVKYEQLAADKSTGQRLRLCNRSRGTGERLSSEPDQNLAPRCQKCRWRHIH